MRNSAIVTGIRNLVFLTGLVLFMGTKLTAQTTITTLPNPPYNGGNSLGSPSQIAFVIENTNGFPILLTAISNWCNTTENNAIWQLYYSATSLSGTTTDVTAAPWTLIATSLATPVAVNGITPLNFPALSFTIPAGTQYRFALRNTGPGNTRYSGTAAITPNSFTGGGVNLKLGDVQIAGLNVGYSGSGTALNTTPRYFTGSITFAPAGPCVNPPVPGTVVSSLNPACLNVPFTLSLSGGTGGTGQTYQWQISPDNITWTNITGATNSTLTTQQTSSNYYRCAVTCGVTVNSAPLQVVTPAAVSGTFTINSALPTGGTNFQSFNDAYNYIRCGISGPVVFNVDPASGPYTEQLILEPVPGASNVNRITFNGNGRTIQFTSTNTNERAVIKLNGADYFIFDNLNITAGGTTTTEFGFGVQLLNNADTNIVRNCTININTSSTSANYTGISISASATSAIGTGSAECDDNLFENNTVVGGFYGITNVGSSTVANQRNRFIGNTVTDFYSHGFYSNGTFQAVIDSNIITRPTRTASPTTTFGILFTGLSTSARVEGNFISRLFDGMTTTTNDAQVIAFTACDALAGLENRVINNVIYDIRSNGSIWALYNSSSDNVFFYHNTVSLDDAASTAASTETTRGFYQITTAAGIELRNNLFTLRRGGPTVITGIHFGTTASTIVSNNNNVFFNPAANISYGFLTTAQATLANWQAASSQDANSQFVNPNYVNLASGLLQPTAASLNNLGAPLGITTDIVGAARSATTPDIGAWEFDIGICTAPPVPGDATSSVTVPICPGEPVTLGLINNSFGTGQTYQWQSAASASGPWTNLGAVLSNPTFNINPTTTLFYRCVVTCAGNSQNSTSVQVVVNPLFPGGTYTINNALPTGGTNFTSFTDAVFALRCGIAGPVVFNVAPGSGPYNEQVIIGQINGASNVNTVTFNGNGATVTFLSTNTNERAVFKLNGTDHFRFDSLTVVPQGTLTTEFGYGFHLLNNADSNIIRRCTINLNTSSTSTNYAGIVSSVGPTATASGTNESDFNEFDRNQINGGYYSITNVGSSTSAVGNNKITNNTLRDFYFYGIYLGGNFNTLVEGNDIARPTRSTVSTCYGIYATLLNTSMRISKNRIHNPFGGAPASTSTFGGIYFTGTDALAGLENVVSNNAIYNINGGGIQYGIYNSSSDNVQYYYNTVNLDNSVASTNESYAFYQTLAAAGIDIRNNIFSVTRTGAGDRYGIFMNTNTTTFTSNNNAFYVTGTNAFTGYFNANQATLANWQAATTQDAASVSGNPYFTDAPNGNLEPRNSQLDNQALPVAGILTDIRNLTRSITTPDPGAWEFTVPPCVAPPVAGTATAVPNVGMCIGTPIALNLNGYSFGSGNSFQWQFATSSSGPWTNLGGVRLFPDTTIQASGSFWYRCIVTCSNQSSNSVAVQVTMNPPFPPGVYTINNTIPTDYPSGTNFNSFVEAVAVMQCGIGGPVTFNVAPGTYNEQVRINRITGASATSRITFQSANGNPASVNLTYDATSAAANYTLDLDSASFITWRAMTVTAQNSTNGRAIELANTASNDSLVNCVINVPTATGTGTTVAGIFSSGNLTGGNHVIRGNTITGGISGIYISGATNPTSDFNVIDSNFVNGSHFYNIYTGNLHFTSVSRNTVTVTGARNTTTYGIYVTNADSAFQVNRNRVTVSGSTVTTTYGIYVTGTAASNYTGSVSRNIVEALTGNTGTLYGMYLTAVQSAHAFNNVVRVNTSAATSYGFYSTGGNGIRYYNNSFQNSSPAAGVTNMAAYFSHSSSTVGVGNIRNNIFSHTANGIAVNYINVSNIYSDYNLFYTAGANLIRFNTVNYGSLDAWKTAQNWDYNSVVIQPAFAAGTDLQPDLANPDVWAMHGRGVQIAENSSDIVGNPRPTTLTAGVPDLGAYEFLPTVDPPALTGIPATPAPGITQRFMFGTDTVQKITWATGSTVPSTVTVKRYSGIIPPGLATGQASMYYYNDVDFTGSAPTGYRMEQFYYDPWMRNIPSEPTVKMGRTTNTGAWFVSSNSTVDNLANLITENNLSFLDRFTGMTDGQAAPPPGPPITTLDTSNRGRRFWVAYGHHYDFNTNAQDMVLYLSAQDSANVTVKVNGTNWVRNYAIPANTVRVSDLMPMSGLVDARITDEGLFNTGISIESDVPIVAYTHIYNGANSGAGLLLPTGVYGYEYKSLNARQYYPTGGAGSFSWTMVIADRDSTLVEITPAVTTKGGRPAGVPFQVYLMRGQVYNVMGTQTSPGGGTDMTGTTVKSIPNASGKCFPIAVFSGSSRTAICNTTNGDNMIQQVFPASAWGTKYLTFATGSSSSPTQYNSNAWRIMVKDPATIVRRNGVVLNPATLITPGNYYEFFVGNNTGANTASYIEADQPIMVAQYMLSSSGTSCGVPAPVGNGDPEMIYISPLEQGIKRATFYNTNQSAITSNHVNVIVPTAGLASLRIDGSSTFTDVFAHPNLAGYTCVRQNFPGAASQHTVVCDSAFTAITYGLGSVESYGYNAGTLVKNLSATPSFSNVFGSGTATYTCRNTPFRLSLQISVKPTQLVWNLSQVNNVTPNANVTQVNPTPADSVVINGTKFYIYTLSQQYTFSAVGTYNIPITVFHPSIEGCGGSVEITLPVTVIAAPVADFTVTPPTCAGTPIQFSGTTTTSNGVGVNNWSWTFGDGGTATVQNPVYSYTNAGTYNVRLRGIALDGCIGDTTKSVVVNPRPVVSITQDTVYVCNNASATFTVQNPVTGATYNWYSAATGGTLLGTGTTFVLNNVTGFTNVFLEGVVQGCVSLVRDRATAAILPTLAIPVARVDSVSTNTIVFGWNAVAGATGYEVSINNGATWSTPSSGSLGLSHTVTGLALGTTVTLQVRALGGCLPAVSQPVSGTTRTDQVYIPNSFSPNGDGLNDVLQVYSNVIRSLRFTVFNQWGEKIAESNNQARVWDGTHNGKPQPSGVYIYVCDIILNNGERIQRKGSINLVR